VAAVVGLGLVATAQMLPVRANIEDDLETRVKAALADAVAATDPESRGYVEYYTDFPVACTGRDCVVSDVPEGADATAVTGILAGVKGLRSLTVETIAGDEDAEEGAEAEPEDPGDDEAEPTPEPTESVPAEPEPGSAEAVAAKVAAMDQIVFVAGKAEWTDASDAILAKIKTAIVRGPREATYEIAVHTDLDGDAAAALKLSQRRADAVRAELIDRGVPARQLTAVGYGQTTPVVDPEKTDDDRAANRRVVLVVVS